VAIWTDPAEVVLLQGVNANVALSALGAPTIVVGYDTLVQELLAYPGYPVIVNVAGLLTDINVVVGAILIPPPVLVFGLDYNSDPLLFGTPVDATWVVSYICQQKALQYWG